MGRLIDADEVKKRFPIMENDFGMVINETLHKELDKIPTVEVYEPRLKADMVAMLKELKEQLREMHEDFYETEHFDEAYGVSVSMDVIQEKIDKLKAESED